MKVDKRAKPMVFVRLPTGCFVCISHKHLNDGYLIKQWGSSGKGAVREMFHRFVWRAHFGDIPEGYEIDHKCNNKNCCNVAHLQCLSVQDHHKKSAIEKNEVTRMWAKDFWEKTKCTGAALGEKYGIHRNTAASWIREWLNDRKRQHLLIHPVCPA